MDEKLLDNVLAHAESYASTRGQDYQDEQNNIRYALIHGAKAGKLTKISYGTCFGALNNLSYYTDPVPTSIQAMLVQMQWNHAEGGKPSFDKNFHLYYEWLFNWSPYRDAFITKDATDATQKGVVIVDADVDNRLMVGGAICLRHPFESFSSCVAIRPLVGLWSKMVESGYDPNYAFVVAMGMVGVDDGWSYRGSSFGHASLRYGEGHMNYHHNFILDRKGTPSPQYKTSRFYNAPSSLFAHSVEKGMNADFCSFLKSEMNKAANPTSSKINPFSTSNVKAASTDAVIKHFAQFQDEFTKKVA